MAAAWTFFPLACLARSLASRSFLRFWQALQGRLTI